MYSEQLAKKLSGALPGDTIKILAGKKAFEGILMPRIELGDPNCLVLKLSNGYNIGIDGGSITKIEVIAKGNAVARKVAKDAQKPSKEDIAILGCGGTIASKVEYKTGAVFPATSPEELILSFPQLSDKKIRSRVLLSILSEDMNAAHWQMIAEEIAKEIRAGVKGIVLMHGTDFMHYTSAALSFMLKTPVPIILTGAQRSSDRGSSDNLGNLMSSVMLAESDIAEIGICMHATMNDDFCHFHPGTKVRKMHTSRRDAFQTINRKPIAKVWWGEDKIEFLSDYKKRGAEKLEIDTKMNPNVGLIKVHPSIKPEFVEKLSDFYDGIVIEVSGIGHAPSNAGNDKLAVSIIPAIKSLTGSGIPVVVAPQTIFGRINMNIYTAGRLLDDSGVIGNYCDWTAETALVKLMWVLGHTKDMKKVKEMMLTNYAGEISDRSEVIW
jgi:glutamyl-tRNA(Gln) amidotransferase subunit D